MRLRYAWAFTTALGALAPACGDDDGAGADAGGDADGDTDADAGSDAGSGDLALGEVVDVAPAGDGSFSFSVTPGAAEERYVLELVSLSRQPQTDYGYTVSVNGAALGAPTTTGPVEGTALPAIDASRGRLRAAIEAVGGGAALPAVERAALPAVGDTLTFEIQTTATAYGEIEAEVVGVSDELVVAIDRTTDPELEIDAGILDDIETNFADVVLPRERVYFGEESDVNADGHVTVLFSPLVYTATGGATAYVSPCDLLADGTAGCPVSNEQELVYVSPPSLLSSYMATGTAMTEVMAHEFQHAIYFYRKYVLNGAIDAAESVYVTEGMSAMAQDLSGFQAGNRYVAGMAIEAVNDFSLADVLAYTGGYDAAYDGTYRGAAYLLFRYAFDRLGGDSITSGGEIVDGGGLPFLYAMGNDPVFGYEALEAAAGVGADALLPDFYTAMLLDDRTSGGALLTSEPRYAFADPWDDPVTGATHGVTMCYTLAGGTWPVQGVSIQAGGADAVIRSGGVEYVLLEPTAAGATVEIGVVADDGAALDARLVRIE
jgi:hypothetical protein